MAELLDLKTLTPDVSKASYLERMLNNNAASYKYYWLSGILDEVYDGSTDITFARLVARMVAGAWYPVVFFHLSLGASDKLTKLIEYLQVKYELPRDAEESTIIAAVLNNVNDDAQLAKLVADRTHNVPYRIIRPFYEEEICMIKQIAVRSGKKWHDTNTDNAIFQANISTPEKAIYGITPDKSSLVVSPDWATFLRENELVIRGWLDFRLTQYLQARNPSVPAISLKLRPPVKRDLATARRYWKCALDLCPLKEIYTGKQFDSSNFTQLGRLSIDHFIPWSFVLHDEAWDLIPMFKNPNSSKSDSLPNLERYLDPFCNQQFDAMLAVKEAGYAGKHRKQFESMRSIDANLDHYADNDASRQSFSASLRSAIVPLYQIALNQGYNTWTYEILEKKSNTSHNVIEF